MVAFRRRAKLREGVTALVFREILRKAVAQLGGWQARLSSLETEIETLRGRHRELLAVTPQLLFITDANGLLIDVGEQWLEQGGISEEEALGLGWMSVLHPDDLEPTQRSWLRSISTGEPLDHEYRLRMARGEYVWFRVRAFPGRDHAGKIQRWYGSAEDINARKSVDLALRESEAFSRSILDSSPDCILVIGNDGTLQFMNKQAFSAMNVSVLGQVKNKPWTELWPEPAKASASKALGEARDGRPARFSARLETSSGEARFWDVSVTAFSGEQQVSTRFLATARDTTDAKLAEERLKEAAERDSLTGLWNRVVLRQAMGEAMTSDRRAALLFIDLDEFKVVNDLYGHLLGDELLKVVGDRLRRCVRDDDLLARLGGDEFAVLLTDVDRVGPEQLAQRIIDRLGEPYRLEGRSIPIHASIGIAAVAGASVDEVLKEADVALYAAKLERKGTYRVFDRDLGAAVKHRQELTLDLRNALALGEFSIAYQPLVQSDSRAMSGLEALLRWTHPVHGRIPPDTFIPLLEETGEIVPVGAWVLDQACQQAVDWPTEVAVAVNISTVQLRAGGLVQIVARTLHSTGLSPGRLQLEITESVFLDESEPNLRTLAELRQLGLRVALDDFGAGYSSLSYLRRFTFDKIKIDRSFVKDITHDKSAEAIVASIIDLATGFGVPATAEGVENEAQLERLLQLGCQESQGFLFGRPVPIEQIWSCAGWDAPPSSGDKTTDSSRR